MFRIKLFTALLVISVVLTEVFNYVISPLLQNRFLLFMALGTVFSILYYGIINIYFQRYQRVKSANFTIRQKLYMDNLTGLLNRRALDRDIKTINIGTGVSCIFLDIDNFRQFNNIYGHRAGDIVLAKVASNILACVRKIDRVYRYGGEEIVILLLGTGKADAVGIAEKIRKRIYFLHNYPYPAISVSLGVSTCPDEGHDLAEILATADKAMLMAKEHGKNRTEVI